MPKILLKYHNKKLNIIASSRTGIDNEAELDPNQSTVMLVNLDQIVDWGNIKGTNYPRYTKDVENGNC